MKPSWLLLISFIIFITGELFQDVEAGPYVNEDNGLPLEDNNSETAILHRVCITRGGNCDHRPHECCNDSTCRCNLWGSNCRCLRKGLFKK